MKKRASHYAGILILAGIITCALGAGPGPWRAWRATVAADPQNVVASELIGTWEYDKTLSKGLGGAGPAMGSVSITFRKSKEAERRVVAYLDSVVRKISLKATASPQEQKTAAMLSTIFLAGEVELHGKQKSTLRDFALVSFYGNPCILYYDRQKDLESTIVMLARDAKGDNDLLFVGGDFNNQSFRAYRRRKS